MILDSFRLDGKVAIVTGSSRGLGQGAALALAEAGADIALLNRGDASETAGAIEAMGRRVHSVHADFATATSADIEAAVAEIERELGRIDILVNNAGTIRRAPAAEYSEDDWNEVLTVNLDSVFHLSRAVGKRLLAQGSGRIINVASMLSFQGGILVPAYTASKHAVAGLTKALANEWATSGVTVNAIAPGYMATDNTAAIRADEAREASIVSRIPMGRWGTPADLQGTFVYLASDAASYVTGTIIPVDGGWLVR
ncbi:2-dehydro-3-deoxy-D-gluconate 5-dehydrogenase KduD [Microbacterium sp. GXS0129]|uniref:2-dehydro-3-deoxy-D-gluconate 5-dehydrogenase KduD n=1 Tax=Microbacterium sp. GXS0129 TaxID=3377836 RepID=UPI00383B8F38